MKKHILSRITLALVCSLSLIWLNTINAFADNPYGIDYSGGTPLGSTNVTEDSRLIDGLSMLVNGGDVDLEFSDSDKWEDGYYSASSNTNYCRPIKYFKVQRNGQINPEDNLYYTISNDEYTIMVQFNNVVLDGFGSWEDNNSFISVGVALASVEGSALRGYIQAGYRILNDQCVLVDGSALLSPDTPTKVFVQTNITLYRRGDPSTYTADGIYFGLTDIDLGQSYKILNTSNELDPVNMYAKSASGLQPSGGTARNMFVQSESGNYIYSQGKFNITSESNNIFVKIDNTTQQEGLDFVFGFKQYAGSGVEFYAHQYVVIYESDENGEISDIDSEHVIAGASPAGSATTPNEGCSLTHWIADQNVTLNNGKTIPAGTPMTMDEIKEVKVESNITFTAYHVCVDPDEPDVPDVPDSGEFTGKNNTSVVVSSITLSVVLCLGLVLCCAFVWLLRMLAKSLAHPHPFGK